MRVKILLKITFLLLRFSGHHELSIYPKKELPFFILFTAALCSFTAMLALLTHQFPEPMANAAKTVSSNILNVECNEPVDATLQHKTKKQGWFYSREYVIFYTTTCRFSKDNAKSNMNAKAHGKDWTQLPVLDFPMCHWSSRLLDLRAPSLLGSLSKVVF